MDIDDGRSREDEQSEDDGENRDQAITDLTLPDEDEEDDVDEDDSQDALVRDVGVVGGLSSPDTPPHSSPPPAKRSKRQEVTSELLRQLALQQNQDPQEGC